jgi:hypothetical protein
MRNFKNYGLFDVSTFQGILEENDFNWQEFDFRQKKFDVHKETKTLPLIFSEKLYDVFESEENEKRILEDIEDSKSKHFKLFEEELKKIQNHIKSILDEDGYIFRAILVLLPKGKEVLPHKDIGKSFFIPRRIHLVIDTNSECYFTVGDVTKNLKEGEIWEINNNGIIHSVSNKGDTDRIHLIFDWIKK